MSIDGLIGVLRARPVAVGLRCARRRLTAERPERGAKRDAERRRRRAELAL